MKTTYKVDCYMPTNSQYGVLGHFTQKMCAALVKRGCQGRLLTIQEAQASVDDPPDFLFGYNGIPEHKSHLFLCDIIEKPNICCLVDLSYRYFHVLESPLVHVGCNDLFSEHMIHETGFKQTFFLPVAADEPDENAVKKSRSIDILLMATFIDYEERRKEWNLIYSKAMVEVLNNSIELAFAQETMPLPEAFQLAYKTAIYKNEQLMVNTQMLFSALSDLELYVRGRDRAELVCSIRHLPLHIYDGSVDKRNWEGYLKGKQTNVTFHRPVNFEESLKVFADSKIVLNSTPHTRQGASERVFNALARGALPLTNQNTYLGSIFESEKDILYFKNRQLGQVEPLIDKYLKDNDLRDDLVAHGRKKVLQDHTWDNRADLLLNYIADKI
jgi:spore maturation protein CgeB